MVKSQLVGSNILDMAKYFSDAWRGAWRVVEFFDSKFSINWQIMRKFAHVPVLYNVLLINFYNFPSNLKAQSSVKLIYNVFCPYICNSKA